MRINYKTTLVGDKAQEYNSNFWEKGSTPEDIERIDEVDVAFCCEDMREAWGDLIGFGEREGHLDKDVNIWVKSYDSWNAITIDFCPFCAEAIECVEVKRTYLKAHQTWEPGKQIIEYEEVDYALGSLLA